jgi:tetratricopeptide (TPR) repeat protein
LALDSTVADAYVARGFSATRQLRFADAATALANARRLDPGSAIAAHWSAIYFNVIGDTLQADEYIERALALDPLSGTTFNSRARMLLERRQFARALENHARAASLSETFMSQSATTLLWAGFTDSAFLVAQRGLTTQVRARYGVAVLTAAATGDWEAARRLRRQIEARGEGVTPYDRAVSALVFGDRAAAAVLFVDHLENDGGFANIVFSVCDPVYDAIRAEPVWKAFLARHQMKECPYASPWPLGAASR